MDLSAVSGSSLPFFLPNPSVVRWKLEVRSLRREDFTSPILLNLLVRLRLYPPYLDPSLYAQQVIQFAWTNVLSMLGTYSAWSLAASSPPSLLSFPLDSLGTRLDAKVDTCISSYCTILQRSVARS